MGKYLPLTHEGRQTLVYLMFAGCGPALTGVILWLLWETLARPSLWPTFSQMALIVTLALFVIVSGIAVFVSIRAIKVGAISIEGSPDRGGDEPS